MKIRDISKVSGAAKTKYYITDETQANVIAEFTVDAFDTEQYGLAIKIIQKYGNCVVFNISAYDSDTISIWAKKSK